MTPWLRAIAACLVLSAVAVRLAGQEAAPAPAGETKADKRAAEAGPPLSDQQAALQGRFDRFEETLAKMAQYLQKTEPARAELVLRALAKSRSERVAERMKGVSGLLAKGDGKAPQYADAIGEQDAILADLRELLTILRSEDILDENRKEQERLKELAKQVSALIDAEKVHQADTQRGEPTDRVAKGQQKTAEKTGEVVKKVKDHDRAAGEKRDGDQKKGSEDEKGTESDKKDDRKEGDQKGKEGEDAKDEKNGEKSDPSKDGQPKSEQGDKGGDQKNQKGDKNQNGDKNQQSGQSQQSKNGQNQQSQGQQSQSQQGQQQDGQDGQQQEGDQNQQQSGDSKNPPRPTPGREDLEAAKERMEKAIEELKKQDRGGASKEQEEAIKKLIEAKEKIEELLRQLREEERELLLRGLEARFQKMLKLQQTVLESTEILKALPNEKWQDREFARCRDAAGQEREIAVEADKALEVLRADGSSVAFPEAVEEIRTDIGEVAARLGREDAGELTVAVEKEIAEALQEMILAFQKEMEKIREQKGQKGQQGQPGDPSLVDKLAELKMLKTLQIRVNRRTKTLGQMFEGEQAAEPDVVAQLRELAERQGRLQRATYDLATGKTAN